MGMGNVINVRHITMGTIVLLAGTLVYIFARPGGAAFLPDCFILCRHPLPPARFWGSLPAFTHTMGICLLAAGVLSAGRTAGAWFCAFWGMVEAAFELGQHPEISPWIATHLPLWFDHIPIFGLVRGFFQRGVFDPVDLAAVFLGAIIAYLVIIKIHEGGNSL